MVRMGSAGLAELIQSGGGGAEGSGFNAECWSSRVARVQSGNGWVDSVLNGECGSR